VNVKDNSFTHNL